MAQNSISITARKGRRASRGAATVETVIVLPVFVLLFVSLLYVRDQAVEKQRAEMQARTCAWLYSSNNCSEIPPGCEGILRESKGGARNSEIDQAMQDGRRRVEQDPDAGGLIGSVMGSLLGPALEEAFGRSVVAETHSEVERPGLYGGGTKSLSTSYELSCNLTPRDPDKVATDAWKLFRP
jgi:hypothetical protein